ncbi:Acyl-CoA thioesterase FadM [Cohaesibacter sp. ES.047]|uniref:acyl-CoA thioesterase n=1 Tax=Cohaesibacter sp. ES.047 TaxID=1798205 RepID=UPI000BB78C8E|nr:acyl-CoA thioesterase [Cohaesibacter sp. ES.047]SNY90744.1 Acyl-CoA thioesterase FadM [Cohaesibacter sp. ES.047]
MTSILFWSGSSAIAWLWGLGMFFSLHFTASYGVAGLLAFAIPNACGLAAFGFILSRRKDKTKLRALAERVTSRYFGPFMLYQFLAVSLTLFALARYLFVPLDVPAPMLLMVCVLLAAMTLADRMSLAGLVRLHAGYLLVMVLAYILLQSFMPWSGEMTSGLAVKDGVFWAYLPPVALGLLFGPWLDLQQWQRAAAMEERGLSLSKGYGLAGLVFFILLLANGALVLGIQPELARGLAPGVIGSDLGGLVAQSVHGLGDPVVIAALIVWCLVGLFATLDSSRLALNWLVERVAAEKLGPLAAFLPIGLIKSSTPLFVLAAGLAATGLIAGVDLQYYMLCFASLFLAYSVVLVSELLVGRSAAHGFQAGLFGMMALCLLAAGYLGQAPLLVALSPFVALLALLPRGPEVVEQISDDGADALAPLMVDSKLSQPLGGPSSAAAVVLADQLSHQNVTETGPQSADPTKLSWTEGWFDERWFNIKLISTYSDTNSVGNVYFASYISWVGKVRELFFRRCMPGFDLKETPFYILTRSISHKFIRETREFEELLVKVRVDALNRKFVTLKHEIRDSKDNLIGKGEQTLMFVNAKSYGLVDVPAAVISSFTATMPETHLRGLK